MRLSVDPTTAVILMTIMWALLIFIIGVAMVVGR